MRAIAYKELGPREKLVLEALPDPVAGPDQLVIETRAVPSVMVMPSSIYWGSSGAHGRRYPGLSGVCR